MKSQLFVFFLFSLVAIGVFGQTPAQQKVDSNSLESKETDPVASVESKELPEISVESTEIQSDEDDDYNVDMTKEEFRAMMEWATGRPWKQ